MAAEVAGISTHSLMACTEALGIVTKRGESPVTYFVKLKTSCVLV